MYQGYAPNSILSRNFFCPHQNPDQDQEITWKFSTKDLHFTY